MLSPKYFIYMVTGPGLKTQLQISSNLRIDAAWWGDQGYRELTFFQPPQTIWIATEVLGRLRTTATGILPPPRFFKLVKRLINGIKNVKYCSYQTRLLDGRAECPILPDGLEQSFWGKCLLGAELPEVIRGAGFDIPWNPEDWMQQLVLQGKIFREAAVAYNSWGVPECRRCGATNGINEADCLFCGEPHCLTCSSCQILGAAKSCTPLYLRSDPEGRYPLCSVQPQLDFTLTPAQQRALAELDAFIASAENTFLVWSVCGGGKTEISFGVIARVLAAGGRVLFAVPRKDVVGELLPRFQKAFPMVALAAWYGGSRQWTGDAQLVLATTHQCVRFYQSFDLVVLDEADAFPYQGSEMLHQAVRRAVKPTGRLVIMTATPDRQLLTRATHGALPYVAIPARYHRRPLIIPQIVLTPAHSASLQYGELPKELASRLIEAKIRRRKLLIFLPTIRLIETLGAAIVKWGLTKAVHGALTHAQSNNVNRNKELLLAGELDFLVTSTVMERGITIPNLDVLVLKADYERVFDCRTLVQIAGRAGRRGEAAQVVFYATAVTREMRDCCRWIRQLNQEGFRLGYLDSF
jgi:competence protein ComFA